MFVKDYTDNKTFSNLDENTIEKMVTLGDNVYPNKKPILQLLNIREINVDDSIRLRVVLSDGKYFIQGMIVSEMEQKTLKKNMIIQLLDFVCNVVCGQKVCIVKKCKILKQMNKTIGEPTCINLYILSKNNHNKNLTVNMTNIANLNVYEDSWTIQVRCTLKENMRYYSNNKGNGHFFTVSLIDCEQTEIRAISFNEVADKFYNVFEKNKIYLISKGSIRPERKGYSRIKNDYCIYLNVDSIVKVVNNDNTNIEIKKIHYKFVKIFEISKMKEKQFVDIIAIISFVGDIEDIVSKRTQRKLKKRVLQVVDETGKIEITLWNEQAQTWTKEKLKKNQIIAIDNCQISHYASFSLSVTGEICVDLPITISKEKNKLFDWFTEECSKNIDNANVKSLTTNLNFSNNNDNLLPLSPLTSISEVEKLKSQGKATKYFSIIAKITQISTNCNNSEKPWYHANPDINCTIAKNCKVTETVDGKWKCEKNGKIYDSYIPRFILLVEISDGSDSLWLTAYDKVAQQILETTAKQAEELYSVNQTKYKQIFEQVLFKKYLFDCKIMFDNWEHATYSIVAAKRQYDFNENQQTDEISDFTHKI